MVNIGSNKFENVAFPLALEDRYFMLEASPLADLWTVFTVCDGKAVVEILKNKPQENDLSKPEANPTGIVTVCDPKTGAFLYKLRPGNRNSSVFGRIKGEETEIRITDKELRIGTNTFQNNLVSGFALGIFVDRNGGFAMGAALPAEIQRLFRS